MSSEHSFRLRSFSAFFGRDRVLDSIDLDLPALGITAILGHSGSGKTTLLRSLNRLNEELANHRFEGEIHFSGMGKEFEIHGSEVDLPRLRRTIGMVFQQPNPLPTTIRRNLSLPLALTRSLDEAQTRERVEMSLQRAELWEEVRGRLDDPASRLSGGQKQRLCLARALILEPCALLLDEPTTALDFRTVERIERTLSELAQSLPLVLVSHSTAQAWRLAERFVVLDGGRILAVGERQQFAGPGDFLAWLEDLIPD